MDASHFLKITYLVGICALGTPGPNEAADVSARIEAVGLYQLEQIRWISDPSQPEGRRGVISHRPVLIQATDRVPFQVGVNFGVEVFVDAPPTVQEVNVRKVTRFPAPGLLNPETGKRFMSQEETSVWPVRQNAFFGIAFEQASDLIPGDWTFEFWIDGDKVAEKTFSLTNPEQGDVGALSIPVSYVD